MPREPALGMHSNIQCHLSQGAFWCRMQCCTEHSHEQKSMLYKASCCTEYHVVQNAVLYRASCCTVSCCMEICVVQGIMYRMPCLTECCVVQSIMLYRMPCWTQYSVVHSILLYRMPCRSECCVVQSIMLYRVPCCTEKYVVAQRIWCWNVLYLCHALTLTDLDQCLGCPTAPTDSSLPDPHQVILILHSVSMFCLLSQRS